MLAAPRIEVPSPRFALHKVVLTAPGLSEVRMVTARGAGDTPTGT